jgi:hypothetical protein
MEKVTESMKKGYLLLINFDDSNEKYEELYDPDLREFNGYYMLSPFMWRPKTFQTKECWENHIQHNKDIKLNFEFSVIL